jgi:hypothetical protein
VSRTERLAHELPLLAVVVVGIAGVVYAGVFHYWRRGLYVVAAACVLGAVIRLVLPVRQVGSLAVRSRGVDVLTLALLGGGIAFLAGAVPA